LQDFSRVYSININPLLYHLQSFWFTISERTWVHCRHSHTFTRFMHQHTHVFVSNTEKEFEEKWKQMQANSKIK